MFFNVDSDRGAVISGWFAADNPAQSARLAIRTPGRPDVLVDGVVVGNYYQVGGYEVSDHVIQQGAHLAESAQPFGILNIGYTGVTSYAYPGGLKLAVINPQ